MRIRDGKVLIDAVAAEDAAALRADLEALDLEATGTYGAYVSGWLPIEAIDELENLQSLKHVLPAYADKNVGVVDSQGDEAMNADEARSAFGVDGSGTTVGTLSDSYDCLGGATDDVASGDLPEGVIVLEEGPCPATDEGRGMMQLIRDVAPGANQAFHTAFLGQADYAQGIIELATDASASAIVDDVIYLSEPMFQDGIVAQAADEAKAMGVPFFSAAGNNNRNSYESAFRPTDQTEPIFSGVLHDFDPGPGVDAFQSITVPVGSGFSISLQWDEPFFSVSGAPGSSNDLDIFVFDETGTTPLAGSFLGNTGGDPVEIFFFANDGSFGTDQFNIAISLFEGPQASLMKYVRFEAGPGVVINEYDTNSSTTYGHANAEGAEAVGAAFFGQTPPFSVDPPEIEPFSSAGGTPILFDVDGNRLADPVVRQKPEIVAPDGTNTTFFGSDIPFDPDAFPNFFGTSAAAPHAAAVAALMLDANPGLPGDAVYAALETTALDMDDPFTPGFDAGFDFGTGFGFIQADAAIATVIDDGPEPPVDLTPPVCGPIETVENAEERLVEVRTTATDEESGIRQVEFIRLDNMQGFANDRGPFDEDETAEFDPTATETIAIRGERISFEEGGAILAEVTNGAGLTATCDPVMETLAGLPERFSLEGNYPNPFSGETTIAFQVAEKEKVTLEVYDLLGRKVVTLVDEEMDAGAYEVEWVVPKLSSGVYFYRIEAGSFEATRRMTLMK